MSIRKKLLFAVMAIFIVVMTGTLGYYILYNGTVSFIDCMYMTVISLTGVGYGEVLQVTGNVPAQIFTMIVITVGMGIILYGMSSLTVILIEGELFGILRRRRMQQQINGLSNHIIVCGSGETGQPLAKELLINKEPVVLIEQDETHIEPLKIFPYLLYVCGDATDDAKLQTAGIKRARGILICLPNDKDNLYVTMTARMSNPHIRIITKMTGPQFEAKFRKAGADSVVSPNNIGALRMASEMIRPVVVDFLDHMLRSQQGTLRINQLVISENSHVQGQKISKSGIKDKFNLLIVAVKTTDGGIHFNPVSDMLLKPGLILIVMGEVDDIAKAGQNF